MNRGGQGVVGNPAPYHRSMRRRDFIALVGGTAIWPVVARAQQGDRVRRVGVLLAYFESDVQAQAWIKALATSLQDLGWNDGRNIQLDYRWGGPNADRLRAGAEELVRLNPDVLVPVATPALIAAQNATKSIPIVFANVADPVGQGLIASFARPGGNTTDWRVRFFDGRQMGAGRQGDRALGHQNWRDLQPGDWTLLRFVFSLR